MTHLIRALAEEITELQKAQKQYKVNSGKRVGSTTTTFLYQLVIKGSLRFKDDAKCILRYSGRELEGEIASSAEDSVIISIREDFGATISTATLAVDETDLLKKLRSALEGLQEGERKITWNDELAYRAIGTRSGKAAQALKSPTLPNDLTDDQEQAIATAFKHAVTYLWGPPGTGKTHTLGAMAQALYEAKQRILIVSHTNRAVDGVLEAFCDRVTERGKKKIPQDKVVRIGSISRESLSEKYGEQVSFEEIHRRWDQEAGAEVSHIERARLGARREIEKLKKKTTLWVRHQELVLEVESLRRELAELRRPLSKVFRSLGIREKPGRRSQVELEAKITSRKEEIAQLTKKLKGDIRPNWEERIQELQSQLSAFAARIASINESVNKRRDSFLNNVDVVATSTTSAFLRAKLLRNFDVILIDEASMVPLPVSFYLSGMVRSRVVIAGDFRQLPPIVHGKSDLVKKWYGTDIFFAAGVVGDVDAGVKRPNLARLTTQFRCHAHLCELINGRFYGGELTTSFTDKTKLVFSAQLEYLRDNRIIVVDTSEYGGSGQQVDTSKANLLHAILVRAIAEQLRGLWSAKGRRMSLGVISPYRAQADLIKVHLVEAGLKEVAVGTVHRFQGDERAVMLLDLTESQPHKLGRFFTATGLEQEGARLLNVALSRAQRNVIILANMKFFQEQANERHLILSVLADVQKRALILPGSSVLENASTQPPTQSSAGQVICPPQYFNEAEFAAAFRADVSQALRELLIVSAFITPNRVRAIAETLAERARVGVSVTAIIPLRQENGSVRGADYDEAVSMLHRLGVSVFAKRNLHIKAVCIDREIVWIGSLNPLSYTAKNRESMMRHVSKASFETLDQQLKRDLVPVRPGAENLPGVANG